MTNFLEKIILGINDIIKTSLFAKMHADKNGLLQKFDPRTKVICTLIFLTTVSLLHSLPILIAINLFTIILAVLSDIPLKFFLKRVWLFLPFYTGIIALPAILNIFSPGQTLTALINIPSLKLYLTITYPGLITAAFLILRVSTSVAFVILLILSTRWADVLKALEVLHLPKVFIMILGMTYRYIFVLLNAADNMIVARKSRMAGKLSGAQERSILLSSLGILFVRSFSLSEEVYLAMLSRGYKDRVHTLTNFAWRTRDVLGLFLCIGISILALKI